jgi:hypothetical protein
MRARRTCPSRLTHGGIRVPACCGQSKWGREDSNLRIVEAVAVELDAAIWPFFRPGGDTSQREGSIKGSISTARCGSCKWARKKKGRFAGLLQSPLTDSNRRPPPYHEREEGADPCGFAPIRVGSGVSPVVAVRRVLHGRATLVRPCDVGSGTCRRLTGFHPLGRGGELSILLDG